MTEPESRVWVCIWIRVQQKREPGGVAGVVLEMAENKMFYVNEGD